MCVCSAVHHHYHMCPVCHKTQACLGVHLRRACMKDATPEAINAAVEKAKDDVHELLKSGRVFQYDKLRDIMDARDPLGKYVAKIISFIN